MREHGTKARYVFGPEGQDTSRGCRCEECRQANRDEESRRSRMMAYGRWQPFVDAGPAREHLRALAAAGIGWKRAAELAGVSNGAVTKILYGTPGGQPSRRVRPETEAAILAVRPSPAVMAATARTDATGTRRRLQALAACGWPPGRLAGLLGVSPGNLSTLMRRERVTAATALAVAALFGELWDVPPPEGTPQERAAASRARRRAMRQGWVPPLAWDDIDDPDAVPAEGWQRGPEGKRRDGALLAAEAQELAGFGLSRAEAAERLRVSRAALEKALERAGQGRAA